MGTNPTAFTVESNERKSGLESKPSREKGLIAGVVVLAIVVIGLVIAVIVLAIKSSSHPSSDACTTAECLEKGYKPSSSDVCTTPGCLETALDVMRSINASADPCDDFYKFACGNWGVFNSERGEGTVSIVTTNGYFKLHEHMVYAISDESMPSSVRKIAVAYYMCGTYGDLKDQDRDWLIESLEEIGGWPMADNNWDERKYHWERNLAYAIHNFAINTPIAITVVENIYDTKKRTIQISQPEFEEMEPLEKERILSMAKKLGGKDANSLEKEYEKMEEFAQQLEKSSRRFSEVEEDSTQTKAMTLGELKRRIPWINWTEFLQTVFGSYLSIPMRDTETIVVVGIDYLSQLLQPLFQGTVSKRTMANYLAAFAIQTLLEANSKLGGTQKALTSPTKSFETSLNSFPPTGFSEGCYEFFTTKASPATDHVNYRNRKAGMMDKKTISYFSSAMKDLIMEAKWLDETTRQRALDKLWETKFFIGFPEQFEDPNQVDEFFAGLPNFTSNLLQNQIAIRRHLFKKNLEQLRVDPDRNQWPIAEGAQGSQTNAFHIPYMNANILPADMQVKPLFDTERPKFWNFASYGWILAHEITHGFDTSGSKRDKYGNMKNWWMPKAKEEFNKRAKCLIEQYNKIPYGYENHYVNGTQTVGENVADNGGLRQAYAAYKKWEKDNGKEKRLPGLEQYSIDQLFFIALAQGYCSISLDPEDLYSRHARDSHCPTPMRTNPAVANFDAFGKAFNCKPGSPMNPVNKCVVW